MLQEERINSIREELFKNKKVLISDLCKKYKVSDVTIRKDLKVLNDEGIIKKIYGGALLNENNKAYMNCNPESKLSELYDCDTTKDLVTDLAISQIKEGDTIFLGSGITCCLLAKKLKKFKNLTIVTNNISAISDLLSFSCKLFIVGGEVTSVDNKTYFSSIENVSEYLKTIHVSKAFTSCSGVDLEVGITVNSAVSTHIYKVLSDINRSWFLMVEKNKFNNIGIYKVGELNQTHCIISNDIPSNYISYCCENNIEVLYLKEDKY